MQINFDSNQFHPSFLDDSDHKLSSDSFFKTSFEHFSQLAHEFGLPNDVVSSALHRACDFFHFEDIPIINSSLTGVFTNNPTTYYDDVLGISREQLMNMGIHDENSLSLIFTHEMAHCYLQYLHDSGQLSQWQTELASDAFMGVRAAAEGLDMKSVADSLNEFATPTHPDRPLRKHYMEEIGVEIFRDLDKHDLPITPDNVLARLADYFKEESPSILQRELEVRKSSNISTFQGFNPSYTDAEIANLQNKVNEAETQKSIIEHELSNLRSKGSLLRDNKERIGDYARTLAKINEYENKLNDAKIELKNAKTRLNNAT